MEEVNIIIDLQQANQICKDALIAYGKSKGLKDIKLEGCVERVIRKRKLLNCKRRGIVMSGIKEIKADNKEISYRSLQEKAKLLGLKANGTPEALTARIKEAENGTGSDEIGREEGNSIDVPERVCETGRDDSIEAIEQDV